MKSIIGRKIGMTSVFATDGTMYPVSVIEVLPNVVTQKKTVENDGYEALQVGYEDKKESRCTKSILGIAKKTNTTPKYVYAELKGDEIYNHEVGQEITCEIFSAGEAVDVTGVSKGHGYSGAIKRWHFHIGPKGHGSGYHRQVGSMATNGRCNNRIHPGKKMSGHHGNKQATILNLQIVSVDPAKNFILIKGAVPGPNKSIVKIRSAVKKVNLSEIKPLVNYSEAK